MHRPDKLDSYPVPEERKYEKIANKILNHFIKHERKIDIMHRGRHIHVPCGSNSPKHPTLPNNNKITNGLHNNKEQTKLQCLRFIDRFQQRHELSVR